MIHPTAQISTRIFIAFLALTFAVPALVVGQTDDGSHRRLVPPGQNGLTKSRLELFLRLQELIDIAGSHADSPDAQPLDPATFEALQQALKDFQPEPPKTPNNPTKLDPTPYDPNTRPLNPRQDPGVEPANPRPNPNIPKPNPQSTNPRPNTNPRTNTVDPTLPRTNPNSQPTTPPRQLPQLDPNNNRNNQPNNTGRNNPPPNDPRRPMIEPVDPHNPNGNGRRTQNGPLPADPKTLQEQLRVLNEAMETARQEQARAGTPLPRPNPQNGRPNPNRPNVNPQPNTNPNRPSTNNNQPNANNSNQPRAAEMDIDDRMLTILERARRRVRAKADADRNEQARNGNTNGDPNDNAGDGWESKLNGLLQRAAERATREGPPPERDERRPPRRNPRQPPPENDADSDGLLSRTGDSLNDMFLDLAGENDTQSSNSSSSSSGASASSFPILPMILVVAVTGIVFWMVRRNEQQQQQFATDAANKERPQMPTTVDNREQVVQAFHAIAASVPEVASNSWTHRKAAEALIEAKPDNEFDVETLADVYEEARYQPADAQFTEAQILKARRAVERWDS